MDIINKRKFHSHVPQLLDVLGREQGDAMASVVVASGVVVDVAVVVAAAVVVVDTAVVVSLLSIYLWLLIFPLLLLLRTIRSFQSFLKA